MFGENQVPVSLVQTGVYKCHAPPHIEDTAGFVPLKLLVNNVVISCAAI